MSQEPPLQDKPSQSVSSSAPSEEKLEKIIERVPPDQYPTLLRETLIGIIREGATPKIDPEVFQLAAATVEKDNENKFQYLMKKLDVDAKAKEADREFEKVKHGSTYKLLWPILIAAILLVLGCTTSGIYLAATGVASRILCKRSSLVLGRLLFILIYQQQ